MHLLKAHTATKSEVAYESIRRAIQQGQLAQGQKVTLKELSELLGMSLTPVREALKELEAHGLIVHEPNRGTFVAEYTRERAGRVYRLRKVLEPLAVELATANAHEEDIARLRDLLRDLDAADTAQAVSHGNEAWHRAIYALSGDPLLQDFIGKLWAGVPFQAISLSDNLVRVRESSAEHHGILEAMANGDASAAADRMRQHIANGERAAVAQF
ncbi:DNA-binding transcriptional regulator, GntR family [Micrococcus luteus]|uniref:DNA-binding transcriptional regulator, GntR family n=1 Tax=Micrococcus luteus TaxID=1270 RepID=A0ABD7MAF1_MICLU|nr:GntR family transcriptional regulator [Micrococcus luteus]MCV7563640.1 GntR family transcriptional regulator [Micrococcus luteus]MCV7636611.1 GntR family transcriptional regulator [Micrococcus luteus]MCV7683531.1 GntR family transcriptional regulator [Micrococcus luteus]MDK7177925.1 GntR family transcriptional regulator [Micrococcus luteus]SHL88394.1 DNA-binding transcriptional regulator, GntR family [Micrococcus luteus]